VPLSPTPRRRSEDGDGGGRSGDDCEISLADGERATASEPPTTTPLPPLPLPPDGMEVSGELIREHGIEAVGAALRQPGMDVLCEREKKPTVPSPQPREEKSTMSVFKRKGCASLWYFFFIVLVHTSKTSQMEATSLGSHQTALTALREIMRKRKHALSAKRHIPERLGE
jgi:hypothetical protein